MPQGYEWLILVGVVALVFGSSQIPKIAKNIGKAQHNFKEGLEEGQKEAKASASEIAKDSDAKSTSES